VSERAGPASLDAGTWPLGDLTRVVEQPVPMLNSERAFTAVAIPNPHLVSFVDAIDDAELSAVGAICEAAPDWLPRRANVSFVQVRGDSLFVRTFERGVGLTNSCGSAMAASTYAAGLTGRIGWDMPVTIFNRGGLVRAVAGEDAMVTLSGNATFEWTGDVVIGADDTCELTVADRYEREVAAWDGVLRMAAGWR
jgi:diaminopimelate epimerase